MKKIEFIDFARGYAIFTIVVFHLLQKAPLSQGLQQAITFGGTGVHLFFLLSGFGLMLSVREPFQAVDFWQRRLLKVWWPFVVALTLSLLAHYALGFFPNDWDAWLAGVLLYQMFSDEYIESFGGHFWFISAVVQFYMLFPVLLAMLRRLRRWPFALTGLLISTGWWVLTYALDKGSHRTWNGCSLQFIWEFALGMALADAWKQWHNNGFPILWQRFERLSLMAKVLLTGIVAALSMGLMFLMVRRMGAPGRIFNDMPALAGYTSLCFGLYLTGLAWLKRFFLWVGSFSFSLYLIHVLLLDMWLLFLEKNGMTPNVVTLFPALPLMLAGAMVFEKLLEK
ncbi:MAG: acyltransferase [Saprospiraceae bacterium]|nr:acyltransferase [Saprospiraceae bacterium]